MEFTGNECMSEVESWFSKRSTLCEEKFKPLLPKDRIKEIFNTISEDKLLVTSSFGTTSAILLHMLSEVKPGHPVHLINTTYLFKETLRYVDELKERLNLNIVEVKAEANKNRFTRKNKTWKHNQDLCCFINKVYPLESIKPNYDVWINGVLGFQNENRRDKQIFEQKSNILSFHPILDMTREEVALYFSFYDLPEHPLIEKGYESIGCKNCTKKGKGRAGRWADIAKTECGLHM